ncbi:MAG TPA: hypothetical protein VF190_08485 [Rhodothermales bacterium]
MRPALAPASLRFLRLFAIATLALGGLLFVGCDSAGDEDTGGVVTLTGRVLNLETNNPVPGAFVRVLPFDLLFEADEEGAYTAAVEIDSTMELQLTATANGFTSDNATILALAGRVIEVPTLRLRQIAESDPVSGAVSNILLLEQSAQSIGVKESGSQEVATIKFQAADSLGRPIILDHAIPVRFSFGEHPGGGEFLSPAEGRTDNNGQVTVNLSSGTRAGVVQIVAEAEADGRIIRSLPVAVSIHGGLPDETHFSLGPQRFNFPGLIAYGIENQVSVIVGDKYGNPARPGTSVYFTTSHGVIGGSTTTDNLGQGTTTLLSANPLPRNGIATITARTADENQDSVVAKIPVVFSGLPTITVEPATAELGQTYSLKVSDYLDNPLVANTVISVRAEGTKVKAVGNTNVVLGETGFIDGNGDGDILDYEDVYRGPGATQFTFRAVEDLEVDETGNPTLETITISVSGENGSLEIVLTPSGGVFSPMKNAVIESISPGRATVRLKDPKLQ